jgi:two-component system phosphate regulon response regulator PhoB
MNDASATSTESVRVLVVEDEADLRDLIQYNLTRGGFGVETAETGEQGIDKARQAPPDLVLLDLLLPRMDGLEVCRRLKQSEKTAAIPVIMVTAKGEDADVVKGLELGADDYVTKPFSPRVLLARVRAVLRRRQSAAEEEPPAGASVEPLEVEGLRLDVERHEVTLDGEPITLTATEFRLLMMLMRRRGRVFTRQQIIETVHGGQSAVTDRSVDVQVVALRRKLGARGKLIETVRGVGYRFQE